MGTAFVNGDRVRVTIEGTVNRVLNFDGTQELRIDADGLDHFIYTDSAHVEKVEPEFEVFGPGDVVRWTHGYTGGTYTVLPGNRLFSHKYGQAGGEHREGITSERYERVEVS